MSTTRTFFKKDLKPILDTIVSILCIIIIYQSLFVEIRYWRVAIFSVLLIFKIVELVCFWKNNRNANN